MKIVKKIITFVMVITVIISSVFLPYKEVKAFDIPTAFWGTLEYSRAFWTAMNTGGALKGGVSVPSFERSGREDMRKFQTQVLIAYKAFCIYKEKLKLVGSGLSESEINEQATTNGTRIYQHFEDNAINVNNTTGDITLQDYGYWREFCGRLSYIAQNGLGQGELGDNTAISSRYYVESNFLNISENQLQNIGRNCFEYNQHYYVYSGQFGNRSFNISNVPTDRVRIPFIILYGYVGTNNVYMSFMAIDVNRLNGSVIATSINDSYGVVGSYSDYSSIANSYVSTTNCPVGIFSQLGNNDQRVFDWCNDYVNNLSIQGYSGSINDYDTYISDALEESEAGKSVKAGGVAKDDIVPANSVPVKRSSLTTDETEATGKIGWDIPDARTLEGAIANPQDDTDERKATGIISVPNSEVIDGTDEDTTITWDRTKAIDVPDEDDETETTVDDVLDVQGGDFYPTQVDLTMLFPFCIPFDIYYCIQKFNVSSGQAPIIHLPIVYPNALKGVLGESYDVVIDFNEYITLRNIIRAFILLLFLIGLMQITRNLIRG